MIAIFLPNFSESHPNNTVVKEPNIKIDPAHADSSIVSFALSGVLSDLKEGRLGPNQPITIPKMKAVL